MKNKFIGISASDGIAYAKPFVLDANEINYCDDKYIIDSSIATKTYEQGIKKTIEQLNHIYECAKKSLGESKAEVFTAHIALANDPEIKTEVLNKINENKQINLINTINEIYTRYSQIFKNMDNEYFKERATDILDVKQRIIANILNIKLPNILEIQEEVILICHELTPSNTAMINKKYIKGLVSEIGGRTSHAAIMARSLEIPCVVGINNLISQIKDIKLIGINGNEGLIETDIVKDEWDKKINNYHALLKELKQYIKLKTKTLDGINLKIEANIGNPKNCIQALENGCEGIGLFRTEFLYMENDHWPTEDEQFEAYKKVLESMKDELVVIRTLDIGGDKKLSYHSFANEMNPFLGYRAIRFCLTNKDVFITQLRALARASVYGRLAIMFPMISTIKEFVDAKQLTLDVIKELKAEGKKVADNIQIGMMMEIPAAAILSKEFAKHADFFSIGTNDLIQYTFACDRMSKTCSYLYQPNNPSLLNLIKIIIDGGHSLNKWVGMCGEMAGDYMSAPILVGLGLNAFSVSATSVAKTRRIINNLKLSDCKKLAQEALNLQTCDEVNQLVEKFLTKNNLQ